MRILAIILLFSTGLSAQINPDYVQMIPSVLGSDVMYTPSRDRLYKISVDSLKAYMERSGLGGGGADNQTVDTFSLSSNTLTLALEDDNEAPYTVDLSSLTTNQTITLSGDVTGSGTTAITTNIATGAVGQNEIATNGVAAAEIATGAVGSSELASTTVTAGSYTSADITVDADGRITSASNGSGGGPGTGTLDRVAYWETTSTLGSFPLFLNGSYTQFTQSTGVQIPDGATFLEPTALAGMLRWDTDEDRFMVGNGSFFESVVTDENIWYETFTTNNDLTLTADDFNSYVGIAANGSASSNSVVTLPTPGSTYRGREVTVYASDDSGTYSVQVTTSSNGIRDGASDMTTYTMTDDEVVTFKLMRISSSGWRWMITAKN